MIKVFDLFYIEIYLLHTNGIDAFYTKISGTSSLLFDQTLRSGIQPF